MSDDLASLQSPDEAQIPSNGQLSLLPDWPQLNQSYSEHSTNQPLEAASKGPQKSEIQLRYMNQK